MTSFNSVNFGKRQRKAVIAKQKQTYLLMCISAYDLNVSPGNGTRRIEYKNGFRCFASSFFSLPVTFFFWSLHFTLANRPTRTSPVHTRYSLFIRLETTIIEANEVIDGKVATIVIRPARAVQVNTLSTFKMLSFAQVQASFSLFIFFIRLRLLLSLRLLFGRLIHLFESVRSESS